MCYKEIYQLSSIKLFLSFSVLSLLFLINMTINMVNK